VRKTSVNLNYGICVQKLDSAVRDVPWYTLISYVV